MRRSRHRRPIFYFLRHDMVVWGRALIAIPWRGQYVGVVLSNGWQLYIGRFGRERAAIWRS